MNKSTVDIGDFRGIREIKPRFAIAPPQSGCAFLVLENPAGHGSNVEHVNGSREVGSSAVFDIGMVRQAKRFGHHYVPSTAQRGAKILRFSDAAHSTSQTCRGVATWNDSCDDPMDCPPAA